MGAYGRLAALVLVALVAITIVGIPPCSARSRSGWPVWIALVYGRYAVGAWLASLAGVESRWAGLLVGVLAVALAKLVPVVGGVVEFAVLLLGLDAIAALGYGAYRGRRSAPEPSGGGASPAS